MADYFEFLNYPKIVSGHCALENIPSELAGYDAQKPLVVAGTQIGKRGLKKAFLKAFDDSTVVVGAVYDTISHYAGITQVREAADLFKARGCDAIIALGDGPVVDTAKAVNVLVSENVRTLQSCHGEARFDATFKPLLVVPSGCLEGWETTGTMTVDNRRITSERLFPQAVIIDARMLKGCLSSCLMESGAITLANALTAISSDHPNPMITAMAHPALRLLCDHWAQGIRQPEMKTAGLALINAAVVSQAAFSNVGPGLVHYLAETLSRETGIHTGRLILALLSPALDAVQSKASSAKEALYLAIAGMERYAATLPLERPEKGVAAVRQLIDQVMTGKPLSLKALMVQEHLLEKTARSVSTDSEGLFSETQCLAVLNNAWNGEGRQ